MVVEAPMFINVNRPTCLFPGQLRLRFRLYPELNLVSFVYRHGRLFLKKLKDNIKIFDQQKDDEEDKIGFSPIPPFPVKGSSSMTPRKTLATLPVMLPPAGVVVAPLIKPDFASLAADLEQIMDRHGLTLDACEGEGVANGDSVWNWGGSPRSGGENESIESRIKGRVIVVNSGELTRRIGIDGSPEEINNVIKAVFGIRTKRSFWLEDDHGIVHAFDRNMPLKTYTLCLDEGLSTKICFSAGEDHLPCCILEKTFYSQDDFSYFLRTRGWIGMKGLRCERNVDWLEDLNSDDVYHGVSS